MFLGELHQRRGLSHQPVSHDNTLLKRQFRVVGVSGADGAPDRIGPPLTSDRIGPPLTSDSKSLPLLSRCAPARLAGSSPRRRAPSRALALATRSHAHMRRPSSSVAVVCRAASLPSSTRPTSCTLPTSSGGSSQRSPATCRCRAGATLCATARLGHRPPTEMRRALRVSPPH